MPAPCAARPRRRSRVLQARLGVLLPGPFVADPRHLVAAPDVDVDRLELPLALGVLRHHRVPGAEPEHLALRGLDVVLEDRPETADPDVVALGGHDHLAHPVLAAEIMVGPGVPERFGEALDALPALALALRPVLDPAVLGEQRDIAFVIAGIERPG